MKIVVLDDHGLMSGGLDWSALAEIGEVVTFEQTGSHEALARISDARIVLTNKTPLDRATLRGSSNLGCVCVLATGYDVVDVSAAREAGVVVCNVPSYGTATVSQYAAALLLELCHHVGRHAEDVRAGGWSRRDRWCYWLNPLMELDGKIVGVIGFGKIGRSFAVVCQALGMRVSPMTHSPTRLWRLKSCGMRRLTTFTQGRTSSVSIAPPSPAIAA